MATSLPVHSTPEVRPSPLRQAWMFAWDSKNFFRRPRDLLYLLGVLLFLWLMPRPDSATHLLVYPLTFSLLFAAEAAYRANKAKAERSIQALAFAVALTTMAGLFVVIYGVWHLVGSASPDSPVERIIRYIAPEAEAVAVGLTFWALLMGFFGFVMWRNRRRLTPGRILVALVAMALLTVLVVQATLR